MNANRFPSMNDFGTGLPWSLFSSGFGSNNSSCDGAPAKLFMNTGTTIGGRPSMGAWVTYGIGSESKNLPGFVVLTSGRGTSGGPALWGPGFLPTIHQGVLFRGGKGSPVLDVDNPAGVVVHPGQGHDPGTLVQALAGRVEGGPDPARPGVVHRLDRDTSGLLVLARDEATHAALQQALRDRRLTREYLALVEGRPPARSGTIDAPLGRDRRVRTRMSSDTDNPRAAITHFETEQVFEGATLLRVRLETGRTHQIRAHLLAIGNPVAGDPEYGHAGRLGLDRQFLHAARLAFEHPVSGETLDLLSPLPEDLATALRQASGERADPLM
jgi:23S rRNA pseudouridine1911/1915/1917 synthase